MKCNHCPQDVLSTLDAVEKKDVRWRFTMASTADPHEIAATTSHRLRRLGR